MRCIVTGGAGFIGANLALYLEEHNHEVIIIDDFSTGKNENILDFKGSILKKDVSEKIEIEGNVDVIFHQAAITDPRHPNDQETYDKNVNGMKNMIALAKEKQAKLIYASSASMYGNGPAPQQEDQEKDLLSAYAKSKLKGDELAMQEKDLHIVGLRYFNVFGPKEEAKGRPASMILHLARQMQKKNRPKIFKMGEQKRDHIYVKDCVTANIKALDAPNGVYNVGTGIGTTFNEIIVHLNAAMGTEFTPEYIDNPYDGTYQNHTQADTTKAESELKFRAEWNIKDAIKDYVQEL